MTEWYPRQNAVHTEQAVDAAEFLRAKTLTQKTKDNNHFVSEFQLRRFLCDPPSKKPGKYFVWVYNSDGVPTQENIKNVASENRFYGAMDDTLENDLANAESKYGQVFKQIISAPESISQYGDQLSDLIWLFGFRTRSFRERLRHSFVSADNAFRQSMQDEAINRTLERKLMEKQIDRELKDYNGFQKLAIKRSPAFARRTIEIRSVVRSAIKSGMLRDVMTSGLASMGLASTVTALLDNEHNKGIQEYLNSGGKCPASAKPTQWKAVQSIAQDFVLGDSGAFALDSDGKLVPSLGIGGSNKELYFPISAGIAAVGLFNSPAPSLTEHEIVQGAIVTSLESFFASRYSADLERMSRKHLGSRKGFIDDEELLKIVRKVFTR